MYSTLLDDQEYDPLLVLYLTTTGAVLQNHTKAHLISYALRQVVYREFGNEPVPFDVLTEVRKNLETKNEQRQFAQNVSALNTVPGNPNGIQSGII